MQRATTQDDQLSLVADDMEHKCRLGASAKGPKVTGSNNNNNNNDSAFASRYLAAEMSPASSGRASNASRASDFSSSASQQSDDEVDEDADGSQLDLVAAGAGSPSAPSSGRSSADASEARPSPAPAGKPLLNQNCNLVHETDLVWQLINDVRLRFLASITPLSDNSIDHQHDDHSESLYDPLDLQEMRRPLPEVQRWHQSLAFRMICRYINFHQRKLNQVEQPAEERDKEIDSIVESLSEQLKFRRLYQINQARADSFAREFHTLNGIFVFGRDRNHTPVLYLRARIHRRWSAKLDDMFRRYVAWQVNTLTKSYHQAQLVKASGAYGLEKDGSFAICFDCLGVSYSCLDMDFLRYLVRLLVHYYPSYCRYALCVDLPWLFRSVWKLVRSWLPEEAQSYVHLIASKELTDFIEPSQIPNSMRFDDRRPADKPAANKHLLPADWDQMRSVEDFAQELKVSSSELKQFKSHVDKVRREYEQLGAI